MSITTGIANIYVKRLSNLNIKVVHMPSRISANVFLNIHLYFYLSICTL